MGKLIKHVEGDGVGAGKGKALEAASQTVEAQGYHED